MLPHQLEDVTKDSVDSLITNAVPEGRSLEYKLKLPSGSDDQKREFLADVSSFANAVGGDILYGIKAGRDATGKPTGFPEEALGLAGLNFDAEQLRLDSIIRDGIETRIAGIRFHTIAGFPNGPVLLIRIPKSWQSPHMVTLRGTSRFYSRTSAGKYQLDITEIRSAFALSEALPKRIQAFRDERLAKILAGDTPVLLPLGGKAILHVLPIAALERGLLIDPRVVHEHREHVPPIYTPYPCDARYNIDGLVLHPHDHGKGAYGYLQVFRSGAFEAVDTSLLETEPGKASNLASFLFEQEIITATQHYLKALNSLGFTPPVFLMLTLTGVKGFVLAVDQRRNPFAPKRPFDRDALFLPDIAIEDFAVDVKTALKPVFDAMWQAAGWPGSQSYTS